jgi:hypothetical protein
VRRPTAIASLALVALLGSLPLSAQGQTSISAADLAVEERLLAAHLTAYQDARGQERTALESLTRAAAALDQALAQPKPDPRELDRLIAEREVASAAVAVVGERVRRAQTALHDLTLRLGTLETVAASLRPVSGADPVSGRWQIQLASAGERGTFELKLEGSLVSGTYSFSDGRKGSVRGTYVGRRLRLERIDAERGLEGVFEGEVDPLLGTARGVWNASELAAGTAAASGWSGLRVTGPVSSGGG